MSLNIPTCKMLLNVVLQNARRGRNPFFGVPGFKAAEQKLPSVQERVNQNKFGEDIRAQATWMTLFGRAA